MSHIVDFFNAHFGVGSSIVINIIFAALAIVGAIVAFRGRQAMVWLVSFCAGAAGVLAGAMTGLLVFDSFIIMLIMAFLGGVALVLLVRFVKGVGYFIGISTLSFFLSYVITSEMYITNAKITESTLLLLDLIIGFAGGIMSLINSKYVVSVVTSAAGGMISSISILVLFGYYFSDWKMWLLALAIAVSGMLVQIKVYDLKPVIKKKQKPVRNKHEKRK
ncbi:MAG: hypothetical protein J1G06_00905 [Oscillospiraceae bacterium]|nr:hypothetical protein [Oscillospiraceae bacterium]